MKALTDEGYTEPTPIQAQAIPHVLAGRDLLGIAQTGTGKTAAFALPTLQRLAANRRPPMRKGARLLVLAPTRELATQIAESYRTYGRHMQLSVATMFGGVSHRPQVAATRNGVDVLVATPGRLIDHLDEKNIELAGTEILILDEADQMLDMGFIRPIKTILARLSAKRQNLFFSATMSRETNALAADILRNPVEVAVTPRAKTADRVAQRVIHIEGGKKRALLAELFADADMSRALVFTRTKRGADKVARYLSGSGVAVSAIHGNKSQNQREAALASFKAGRIRALVATDIAARGIDIDEVTHVINYELPNIPEAYVHRIGRTARAGAEGIAISLCDAEERAFLRDIEKLIRQSIPSSNRCGDASLVVDERHAAASASDGEAPARRGRPQQRGGRSQGQPARRGAQRRRYEDKPRAAEAQNGRSAPAAASATGPAAIAKAAAANGKSNGHGRAKANGNGNGAAAEAKRVVPSFGQRLDPRPAQPRADQNRDKPRGSGAAVVASGNWRPRGQKSGQRQQQPSR
jgi:ATP-dependent RNA helicase RhlE